MSTLGTACQGIKLFVRSQANVGRMREHIFNKHILTEKATLLEESIYIYHQDSEKPKLLCDYDILPAIKYYFYKGTTL